MEWQTSITYDEYEDAINEAVEALSLPHFYKTFFLHHVCPDLKEMNCVSRKEKFRKYACLLQKKYPCTSEIKEIHIRRIMKHVIPNIFLQIPDTKENQTMIHITKTDKDIVQYLGGAILKWGINKLPKEESDWCKTQVSTTNKLSSHFEKMNRGLVVPNDEFLSLVLKCERKFREMKDKRKISPPAIIDKVFQQGIAITNSHENAMKQLLGRYIRMRAHISTKHTEKLNLQKKQMEKAKKSTHSLRRSLKLSN